jgi:Pentapeptide repeats (8 copies)
VGAGPCRRSLCSRQPTTRPAARFSSVCEVTMPIEIKRSMSEVILTAETLAGIDLSGRDLRSANFQNADMRGCNLRGSDLRGALFMRAALDGSDMRDCLLSEHFHQASLRDVQLNGSTVHWGSREIVSAILLAAAQTDAQREYAVEGLVTRACWDALVAAQHSEMAWAVGVLAPYVNVQPAWKAPQILLDAAAR